MAKNWKYSLEYFIEVIKEANVTIILDIRKHLDLYRLIYTVNKNVKSLSHLFRKTKTTTLEL